MQEWKSEPDYFFSGKTLIKVANNVALNKVSESSPFNAENLIRNSAIAIIAMSTQAITKYLLLKERLLTRLKLSIRLFFEEN
ncbi:MAG: hypothetical protein ABI237_12935 [Ginsengibacter sp.]